MKTKTHVGNVSLVLDGPTGGADTSLLLGLKRPKDKSDAKRKRRRIGIGRWVPPGGGTEVTDKSQKHSAQRELWEETGLSFPLHAFKKVGVLRGYLDSSGVPHWIVHLYLVIDKTDQEVRPNRKEYSEMRWFPISRLPFKKMLDGDRVWIPKVIGQQRQKLSIRIRANKNADRAFSIDIRPINSFN